MKLDVYLGKGLLPNSGLGYAAKRAQDPMQEPKARMKKQPQRSGNHRTPLPDKEKFDFFRGDPVGQGRTRTRSVKKDDGIMDLEVGSLKDYYNYTKSDFGSL